MLKLTLPRLKTPLYFNHQNNLLRNNLFLNHTCPRASLASTKKTSSPPKKTNASKKTAPLSDLGKKKSQESEKKITLLPLSEVMKELQSKATVKAHTLTNRKGEQITFEVHSNSLQSSQVMEDFVIEKELLDRVLLCAVLDGYQGHQAATFVSQKLPVVLSNELKEVFDWEEQTENAPEVMGQLAAAARVSTTFHSRSAETQKTYFQFVMEKFMNTFVQLDEAFLGSWLPKELKEEESPNMSPTGSEMDPSSVSESLQKAMKTANPKKMKGIVSGVCVSTCLFDAKNDVLFVANMGNCKAVLLKKHQPGSTGFYYYADLDDDKVQERKKEANSCSDGWDLAFLTSDHTPKNPKEERRIKEQEVYDPDVIVDGKVKGLAKVTRAIGDGLFKSKELYSVFHELTEDEHLPNSIQSLWNPPYILPVPETVAYPLQSEDQLVIIMATESLWSVFSPAEVGGFLKEFQQESVQPLEQVELNEEDEGEWNKRKKEKKAKATMEGKAKKNFATFILRKMIAKLGVGSSFEESARRLLSLPTESSLRRKIIQDIAITTIFIKN